MAEATPAAAPPPQAPAPQANASGEPPATDATLPTPQALGKATKPAPKPTNGKGKEGGPPAEAKPPEDDGFEIKTPTGSKRYTREQAIRELQKGAASTEAFQKAKELTRQNQALLSQLKENPTEALRQLGVDVEELAKKTLGERLADEMLSPEQREAKAQQKELEKLRTQMKQREESDAKAAQDAQDKSIHAMLEKRLVAAADKHGLEGNPDNLYRLAETAKEFLDLGVEFTEEQLISEVKEREAAAFDKLEKQVVSGLKGKALAQRLGPKVVEEVLRWSMQELRGGNASAPTEAPAPRQDKAPSPYISETEFRKKHGF